MKDRYKEIIVNKSISLIDLLLLNIDGISKSKFKSMIKYKSCEVNKKIVTNPNIILKPGDRVKFYFERKTKNIYGIDIIFEDEDLIVINKPSGLLSISNQKEKELTAFRLVSDYIKENNKNNKLFVVHRLDQDTSGVLLFAKNEKTKEMLQKNWNDIVKVREYIAIVHGKAKNSDDIKSYLTMNHFQKVYSTKNKEIGNFAHTTYTLIKYENNLSLLNVLIYTGKRNQIRVHLSENGLPIVGDKKYGLHNPIDKDNRLMLHASTLSFIYPKTNKELVFKAKIPKEFKKLIK